MVKTKQTANKTTSKKVEVTKKDKAPLPPPKGKGRTTAPKVDKVTASKVVEKKAVAPKKTTTKKVVNEESQDLEGVLGTEIIGVRNYGKNCRRNSENSKV